MATSGYKRTAEGKPKTSRLVTPIMSPYIPMFETFRNELDEHHDRRERIIKASRDITALSKKMIFSLQRVRTLNCPIPADVAKENNTRFSQINFLFLSITPDLNGINAWRYQRQISGGIQEYMEAVSFQHYLERQRLITFAEAKAALPLSIELTEDDYVLGLFDLVGELMRFAITSMATLGEVPGGTSLSTMGNIEARRDMATDLRSLRAHFEALDTAGSGLSRDVGKKMEVMQTCVGKVENAVYGMIIRGRERPKGWVPDVRDDGGKGALGEAVESY